MIKAILNDFAENTYIINEKDGVKFSFIMMRNILNTQVEEISEKA